MASFDLAGAQKNMSGFLHAIGVSGNTKITPLKPAMLRFGYTDSTTRSRGITLGCNLMPVLSDVYGYPGQGTPWNGNPAPWDDSYATWDALVQDFISTWAGTIASYGLDKIYINVWNEPDVYVGNFFWSGTQAQYFELYRRTVVAILAVYPSARIGGPSLANYDHDNLIDFLDYCQANGLKPFYIDWHELSLSDSNIPGIALNIKTIKQALLNYPTFNNAKIIISEAVGPANWLRPGPILGWMYYMEQGGADFAVKACWDDETIFGGGQNTCFNGGLDGLLNATDGGTRAAWHAYKTYADGVGNRVSASSDNPNLVVLASKNAPAPYKAQVLLGYSGSAAPSPEGVTVQLNRLDMLGFVGPSATVTVYKVPDSGEAVVASMTLVSTTIYQLVNKGITFNVTIQNKYEEYVIYLS